MKNQTNKRGGKRSGAGRKPSNEEPEKHLGFRLPSAILEKINAKENPKTWLVNLINNTNE